MGGYLRRLCPIPTLWKDTERRTLFTVYFCLGYSFEVKEARIFHFLEFDMVDALRIVIELKKVKADDLKARRDNRAPIVGPSSITPWMMF